MRVQNDFKKCVVFVGFEANNAFKPRGTAFLVRVPAKSISGKFFTYLVTAKHVAERLASRDMFTVRFNNTDGTATLARRYKYKRWWIHPADESVDVAVFHLGDMFAGLDYARIPMSMFITKSDIDSAQAQPTSEMAKVGVGDEVFSTGLFTTLAGNQKNMPIVRIGNLAMLPDEKIRTGQNQEIDAYLIESRSLGGLSGSPVFIRPTISAKWKEKDSTTAHEIHGVGEIYFLGLIHGHMEAPMLDKIYSKGRKSKNQYEVNAGIAVVVPAIKIEEVINQPDLVEFRNAEEEKERRTITGRT